jgi:hypothetical protein
MVNMADLGKAWQTSCPERFIRTVRKEEDDLSEHLDYRDAYHQIGRFLDDVYVHKWIHSSLGYLTPTKFEAQCSEEHVLALEFELRTA